MSDLQDALLDIQGVGEATAEKILEVVADHETPTQPELKRAIHYAKHDEYRNATVWLKRFAELEDE